jgi:hypothetical protein
MGAKIQTPIEIAAAVEELPILRSFNLKRFVSAVSDRRPKPIELVDSPMGGTAPCGWLVRTREVDYVCYPTNTSRLHQLHIVLHEIGHLVLGHTGDSLLPTPVHRDSDIERAAETFAMMAARRITHVPQVILWEPPEGADVAALGAVFDSRSTSGGRS